MLIDPGGKNGLWPANGAMGHHGLSKAISKSWPGPAPTQREELRLGAKRRLGELWLRKLAAML
jgi:hypothetical protein